MSINNTWTYNARNVGVYDRIWVSKITCITDLSVSSDLNALYKSVIIIIIKRLTLR